MEYLVIANAMAAQGCQSFRSTKTAGVFLAVSHTTAAMQRCCLFNTMPA
jgi:hypothetical protein